MLDKYRRYRRERASVHPTRHRRNCRNHPSSGHASTDGASSPRSFPTDTSRGFDAIPRPPPESCPEFQSHVHLKNLHHPLFQMVSQYSATIPPQRFSQTNRWQAHPCRLLLRRHSTERPPSAQQPATATPPPIAQTTAAVDATATN